MKKNKFDAMYNQIMENTTAASAGVGATQPSTDQSTDSYAPGDARTPKVLGSKKKKPVVIKRSLPASL